MNLNTADLENICEALDQMEFRCARNIRLVEDVLFFTADLNAETELALLRSSLARYHATKEKIQVWQQRGSRDA